MTCTSNASFYDEQDFFCIFSCYFLHTATYVLKQRGNESRIQIKIDLVIRSSLIHLEFRFYQVSEEKNESSWPGQWSLGSQRLGKMVNCNQVRCGLGLVL